MKTFIIGRDPEIADIVIYDTTDYVSRNHATLISRGRKFFITDHSVNGTYRNGVKLLPNVEYQITRDDVISFANVAYLDWNVIPKKNTKFLIPLLSALAFAGLLICFLLWYNKYHKCENNSTGESSAVVVDSTDNSSMDLNEDENQVSITDSTVVATDPAKADTVSSSEAKDTTDAVKSSDKERPRIVYPPVHVEKPKAKETNNEKKSSVKPSSKKSSKSTEKESTTNQTPDSPTTKAGKMTTKTIDPDSVKDASSTTKHDAI